MADPTFDSVALFTDAMGDSPGSPQPRVVMDFIPDVDGAYVQMFGKGPRRIVAYGILAADGNSAALAAAALKTAVRTRQAKADGSTLGTYASADGNSHTSCYLESYQLSSPPRVQKNASSYTAFARATAVIVELSP